MLHITVSQWIFTVNFKRFKRATCLIRIIWWKTLHSYHIQPQFSHTLLWILLSRFIISPQKRFYSWFSFILFIVILLNDFQAHLFFKVVGHSRKFKHYLFWFDFVWWVLDECLHCCTRHWYFAKTDIDWIMQKLFNITNLLVWLLHNNNFILY